jgi:putative sterol carrier protein
VQATVQWEITDDGEQHDYVVELDGSQCTTGSGKAGKASTTLRTDLARFARLTAGQANGIKLLATRKLRASGDVNLARRLPGMFDIPKV